MVPGNWAFQSEFCFAMQAFDCLRGVQGSSLFLGILPSLFWMSRQRLPMEDIIVGACGAIIIADMNAASKVISALRDSLLPSCFPRLLRHQWIKGSWEANSSRWL